MVTGII